MSTHRITLIEDAWQCRCGEDATGYASLAEARIAAAEHQLPEPIQREIEDAADTVEHWRQDVLIAADEEAAENPDAWRWYLNTDPS